MLTPEEIKQIVIASAVEMYGEDDTKYNEEDAKFYGLCLRAVEAHLMQGQEPILYADKNTMQCFRSEPYSREARISVRLGDYVHKSDIPLFTAPPSPQVMQGQEPVAWLGTNDNSGECSLYFDKIDAQDDACSFIQPLFTALTNINPRKDQNEAYACLHN